MNFTIPEVKRYLSEGVYPDALTEEFGRRALRQFAALLEARLVSLYRVGGDVNNIAHVEVTRSRAGDDVCGFRLVPAEDPREVSRRRREFFEARRQASSNLTASMGAAIEAKKEAKKAKKAKKAEDN